METVPYLPIFASSSDIRSSTSIRRSISATHDSVSARITWSASSSRSGEKSARLPKIRKLADARGVTPQALLAGSPDGYVETDGAA